MVKNSDVQFISTICFKLIANNVYNNRAVKYIATDINYLWKKYKISTITRLKEKLLLFYSHLENSCTLFPPEGSCGAQLLNKKGKNKKHFKIQRFLLLL